MEDVFRLRCGAATITAIKDGEWLDHGTLAEVMNVPESEWRAGHADLFAQPFHLPCWCFHIALPGASIVVDAGFGEETPAYRGVTVRRTAGLVHHLGALGVRPGDVTHVMITHAHEDHYAGLTAARAGRWVPVFPQATCYVGAPDWLEHPRRHQPGSVPARTFGVLAEQGRLELVAGDREVVPGVRMLHAPGETRGHSIVRVAGAPPVYLLGDLYHHTCEVSHPGWNVKGRDQAANTASRQALAAAALREGALLLASHLDGPGRLRPDPGGVVWETVGSAASPGAGPLG